MKTADFDYHLPPERIAQTPIEPRDAARLMVLPRAGGPAQHAHFRDLPTFLRPGDLLIFNDTRVIPARLLARKTVTGGKAELLMLRRREPRTWEVLAGGKGVVPGTTLDVEGAPGLRAVVVEDLGGARRLVQFSQPVSPLLAQIGQLPLPPYIHAQPVDRERYQTVYARVPGSAAAPTAGLHFTRGLLEKLRSAGVRTDFVTLHVGLDTFQPVNEADPAEHAMHGEWCAVRPATAQLINATRAAGGRVIAVGTTSVRTLESAAHASGNGSTPAGGIAPFTGSTHLYILPGYTFRVVDGLITNFHLPRSTLLMLVAAFAGRERILAAYAEAIQAGYRFYSFGDAMLLL